MGNGIESSGVDRHELFLVTKVNFKSYEYTRETVEQSLRKLRTDYLDLVLLHWPFANYYAAWRELEKLHAEGKIRAIGVSSFEPDRLVDLIAYNSAKPAVNQIETHLYCQRQAEHEWEKKYGVAHMAYAPLGQGKANTMYNEPAVRELAAKYGKTPAQVLLRGLDKATPMIGNPEKPELVEMSMNW
ncbi:aldo/keto reductase [Mitsuokella multacida]|uniref:aldo/keto reductase n=1 Tax=Mitsuokella multacida TaxID=52226 RepID=UPI0022E90BB0|nr:aldo/keto reductase [Mitsuokella multacida]